MSTIWKQSKEVAANLPPEEKRKANLIGWSMIGFTVVGVVAVAKGVANLVHRDPK